MGLKFACFCAFIISCVGTSSAYGQDTDLKSLVNAIRQVQTPVAPKGYTTPPPPGITRDAPAQTIFLTLWDGKLVSDQVLNAHTLDEVVEVALRFDPTYPILYGTAGAHGIIMITSRKERVKR